MNAKKFSDEWGDFEIRVNDPRGQNWLYKDSHQTLTIGWNHENPGHGHVYLSEVSTAAVPSPLKSDRLFRSIARFFGFMVKPGGGYSSVQLHIDSQTSVLPEEIALIDGYLSRFGLQRVETSKPNEPMWIKRGHDLSTRRSVH